MKQLKYILLVLVIFFFSCKEKVTNVPGEYVQPSEMATIMVDYITERQKLKYKGINSDSTDAYFHSVIKRRVLKRHEVSKEKFDSSYKFYVEEPARYQMMWQIVADSTTKRLNAFEQSEKL